MIRILIVFIALFFSHIMKGQSQQVLFNQKVVLNGPVLRQKPFYRNGMFRSRQTKTCNTDVAFQFGAYRNDGYISMILVAREGGYPPMEMRVNADTISEKDIYNFLDSFFKTISYSGQCEDCVQRFNWIYSKYIIDVLDKREAFPYQDNKGYSFVNNIQTNSYTELLVFPSGAIIGGSYTVTAGDAVQYQGGILFLPEDFTLKADPAVALIDWHFHTMIVNTNATIDLSHRDVNLFEPPINKPPKNDANFFSKSCPSCKRNPTTLRGSVNGISDTGTHGFAGINGMAGTDGLRGTNFVLLADNISMQGSLWVKTDGSNGTNGQPGGDGGNGAYGDCGSGPFGKGINGGNGGNGGFGGKGGNGGDVAAVSLRTYDASGNIVTYAPAPSSGTTNSLRPGSVTGNTGLISIYGNPGKHGNGGFGGAPGTPAPRCPCCNTANCDPGKPGIDRSNQKIDGKDGFGYQPF